MALLSRLGERIVIPHLYSSRVYISGSSVGGNATIVKSLDICFNISCQPLLTKP